MTVHVSENLLGVVQEVPENRQMVAVTVKGVVSTDPGHALRALEALGDGIPAGPEGVQLVNRFQAKFMAGSFQASSPALSEFWRQVSEQPTLFGMDEDSNPVFVLNGVFRPKTPVITSGKDS